MHNLVFLICPLTFANILLAREPFRKYNTNGIRYLILLDCLTVNFFCVVIQEMLSHNINSNVIPNLIPKDQIIDYFDVFIYLTLIYFNQPLVSCY